METREEMRLRFSGAGEEPLRVREHVVFDSVVGPGREWAFAPVDGGRSQLISALPKNVSNFVDGWPLGQCSSGPSGTKGPINGFLGRRQQA